VFTTAENIPSWELVLKALEIHQKTAHPANTAAGGGNTAKVDKKIRPSISPQMSEENWRFFSNEWERYKRQTGVSGTQLLDELWSCMTEELRQLAFAEGGSDSLQTEADMTTRIKKLAVVALHPSVHVVNHMITGFFCETDHFLTSVRCANFLEATGGCDSLYTSSKALDIFI
jgi:hypothetical protein